MAQPYNERRREANTLEFHRDVNDMPRFLAPQKRFAKSYHEDSIMAAVNTNKRRRRAAGTDEHV